MSSSNRKAPSSAPVAKAEISANEAASFDNAPIAWIPTVMFTVTTLLAVTVVPWYGFSYGFETSAVVSYLVITWLTGMAITGGYHRLWAHNSYDAHPILKVWYALWGAAALQNTILDWTSGHRIHHRHCDDVVKDPYSAKRGLWFSHMGWMLREYPSGKVDFNNVKNIMKDPIVMWQYKYYAYIAIGMNILVPLALGLIFGDVWGMLLIAGVLRIVSTHHVTFFINSIAHKWGSQPYTDENTARDNALFAFFTHGEGYHNYHHIFQTDYRNGIRWYHWDPTKWFIKGCSFVGLSSNLKVVPNIKIQRALINMQFKRAEEKLATSKAKAQSKEKWGELLEKEYDNFRQVLNEWTELQALKLEMTKKSIREKWETSVYMTRLRELEYSLKMQQRRLQLMTNELSFA